MKSDIVNMPSKKLADKAMKKLEEEASRLMQGHAGGSKCDLIVNYCYSYTRRLLPTCRKNLEKTIKRQERSQV